LPLDVVEQLREDVRRLLGPQFPDESIPSVTSGKFVEDSLVLKNLMAYEPLMKIVRYINYNMPITLNRSVAIFKKPGAEAGVKGSGAMAWHTDWEQQIHPYRMNAVLNNTGACSYWFYFTGSKPVNGGLSIIPDSHTDDWEAPEGFEFTKHKNRFTGKGRSLWQHNQIARLGNNRNRARHIHPAIRFPPMVPVPAPPPAKLKSS
jgi:hypothetical protein